MPDFELRIKTLLEDAGIKATDEQLKSLNKAIQQTNESAGGGKVKFGEVREALHLLRLGVGEVVPEMREFTMLLGAGGIVGVMAAAIEGVKILTEAFNAAKEVQIELTRQTREYQEAIQDATRKGIEQAAEKIRDLDQRWTDHIAIIDASEQAYKRAQSAIDAYISSANDNIAVIEQLDTAEANLTAARLGRAATQQELQAIKDKAEDAKADAKDNADLDKAELDEHRAAEARAGQAAGKAKQKQLEGQLPGALSAQEEAEAIAKQKQDPLSGDEGKLFRDALDAARVAAESAKDKWEDAIKVNGRDSVEEISAAKEAYLTGEKLKTLETAWQNLKNEAAEAESAAIAAKIAADQIQHQIDAQEKINEHLDDIERSKREEAEDVRKDLKERQTDRARDKKVRDQTRQVEGVTSAITEGENILSHGYSGGDGLSRLLDINHTLVEYIKKLHSQGKDDPRIDALEAQIQSLLSQLQGRNQQ